MLIRVIDFETTGMPPSAAVCEVGWCDLRSEVPDPSTGITIWIIEGPWSMLVNPNRPMPPEARAVHHIGDADLVGAPEIANSFMALAAGKPTAYAAHNAAFEKEFFSGGEAAWICTLKAGRRLWPECPSHTNQCLRYFLGIELEDELAMPPHRAGPDAYVTAHLLAFALDKASVEDLIDWTKQPSLLPRVTFGKHRGSQWSDLPSDYLQWLVSKSDMDADTKFTAKHWLDARRSVQNGDRF